MHDNSYQLMDAMLNRLRFDQFAGPGRCLDVGSYNVNGSYRPLLEARGWYYVGLDVRPGPNVDIMLHIPYQFPFDDGEFDAVICGNMLHNVFAVWMLVVEMRRVLKPGGLLAIVCPFELPYPSNYPEDFWRFCPAALRELFQWAGGLHLYQIELAGADIAASAIRRVLP